VFITNTPNPDPLINMKMIPTSLRIREDDLQTFAEASEKTGAAQADLIRLALKIGMASLAKIGFDPDAVIMAKVDELEEANREATSPLPVNRGPRINKAKR